MKKGFAILLVLLLFPLAASAETVVTSFYPIWLMALNLTDGIEQLNVVNLSEPTTGCLHDYTLRNSDMVALSEADALLINGAGMESFLPVITGAYPDLPIVDASEGIPFLTESATVEIGESEEGETVNSHLWLDPQRAAGMAANLAEGLIRLFPSYEDRITANLRAYRDRLQSLDLMIRDRLDGVPKPKVILFHEALPYFAEACGLSVIAVVNKEPDDDLSSAELVRVADLIRSEDSIPLVLKTAETDRAVSVLVSETGVPVCELDPVTSGPEQPPLDYYETVMIRNLDLLLADR